jgi:hypothetical protein
MIPALKSLFSRRAAYATPLATVIMTIPGVTKSIYFTEPVSKDAPKTYTNSNIIAIGIAATVIIVSILRTV